MKEGQLIDKAITTLDKPFHDHFRQFIHFLKLEKPRIFERLIEALQKGLSFANEENYRTFAGYVLERRKIIFTNTVLDRLDALQVQQLLARILNHEITHALDHSELLRLGADIESLVMRMAGSNVLGNDLFNALACVRQTHSVNKQALQTISDYIKPNLTDRGELLFLDDPHQILAEIPVENYLKIIGLFPNGPGQYITQLTPFDNEKYSSVQTHDLTIIENAVKSTQFFQKNKKLQQLFYKAIDRKQLNFWKSLKPLERITLDKLMTWQKRVIVNVNYNSPEYSQLENCDLSNQKDCLEKFMLAQLRLLPMGQGSFFLSSMEVTAAFYELECAQIPPPKIVRSLCPSGKTTSTAFVTTIKFLTEFDQEVKKEMQAQENREFFHNLKASFLLGFFTDLVDKYLDQSQLSSWTKFFLRNTFTIGLNILLLSTAVNEVIIAKMLLLVVEFALTHLKLNKVKLFGMEFRPTDLALIAAQLLDGKNVVSAVKSVVGCSMAFFGGKVIAGKLCSTYNTLFGSQSQTGPAHRLN